jgi:hypothetical protein
VLARINLNAEGPERMAHCEAPTKLNGNILEKLGSAQRNLWIVHHCRIPNQLCDYIAKL